MASSLLRRAVAETTGTALLLSAVVGSGIMAERLAGGNVALALLANALATGGALVAIILAFGPISGAHLNPAITLADAWQRGISWRDVPAYVIAQMAGAVLGVVAANLMFGLPAISFSHHERAGAPLVFSEFVATFGLLAVIWGCARARPDASPYAVAAYIVGAYWFTSSTSFANPAVAFARSLSDTFAGIRPADVLPFILAQLAGAAAATGLFSWLQPMTSSARNVVLPHSLLRGSEPMLKVLFVCVHNSARSQMAEAFLNLQCPGEMEAQSAGLEPGTMNPLVVEVMREVGVDLAGKPTRGTFDVFKSGERFDYVVTVCDETSAERCPIFPGYAKRLHWSFADPSTFAGSITERLEQTRRVRDDIRTQIESWCLQTCRKAS